MVYCRVRPALAPASCAVAPRSSEATTTARGRGGQLNYQDHAGVPVATLGLVSAAVYSCSRTGAIDARTTANTQ